MNAPAIFRNGAFEVTDALLRTPRKTYSLRDIQYVSVQRPLLFFVGLPAMGLIGFGFAFWRYLLWIEILSIAVFSSLAILAALHFGVLRVHSLALRDDEVATSFGPISQLKAIRVAVEAAMEIREAGR